MHIQPAELVDLNICCQMTRSYTTDYVWQMQSSESDHTVNVRFDIVRLPRSMRVEYPRSTDELIEHWRKGGCFLVLRSVDDTVVGFVDAQPYQWQHLLWISNLVVDPRRRRRGFGSRLLDAAVSWAREHHLHQVMLEMQTKNYPAIRFAQKHGFQYCGYNEQYYPNGDIALFFARAV